MHIPVDFAPLSTDHVPAGDLLAIERAHLNALTDILDHELLEPLYQPIVKLADGSIFGYEGLIRGPADSLLHLPQNLFETADRHGRLAELEWMCCRKVVEQFAQLGLPERLFVNISPRTVAEDTHDGHEMLRTVRSFGNGRNRIVIELTEHRPAQERASFHRAVTVLRALGFGIALDDLGEGFSSLRLWSDINPEFVKVDMHFVQGIHRNPFKFQFLKSLQQIAENCGSMLVAEGIEAPEDLRVLRDLGVAYGQGFLIARPSSRPPTAVGDEVRRTLDVAEIAVYPSIQTRPGRAITVERLLIPVTPISPETTNDAVFQRFELDTDLRAMPVVDNGILHGLVNRHQFIDRYVRPYRKELYGRRPCTELMDCRPLTVEKDLSLHELSQTLADVDPRHLGEGFVITHFGRYLGMGSAQDLIREITRLQIDAARYANPLTLLPGNVPISEHIDRLLRAGLPFSAAYCDLNHFKPFNDAYGYSRGDEMIKLAASILARIADSTRDFLGHIGGDDFMLLFQSEDWEERNVKALEHFETEAARLFDEDDIGRGALAGEDRKGNTLLFPLTSLAIGVVRVLPSDFASHLEVSTAAAEAKRQAKRKGGNALFIERRRPGAAVTASRPGVPAVRDNTDAVPGPGSGIARISQL